MKLKNTTQEHKLPIEITKTWLGNGDGDGMRKTYVVVVHGEMNTPLGVDDPR